MVAGRLKKILIFMMAFVFALTPFLLSGCVGDLGGESGGDGGDQQNFEESDYINGVKIAYRKNIVGNFERDVYVNTQLMAVEILANLCGYYGFGIPGIAGVTETYKEVNIKDAGDNIRTSIVLDNLFKPAFVDEYTVQIEYTSEFDGEPIIETYDYTPNNQIWHLDSIRSGLTYNGVLQPWSWSFEDDTINLSDFNDDVVYGRGKYLDKYLEIYTQRFTLAILSIMNNFLSPLQSFETKYQNALNQFDSLLLTYSGNIKGACTYLSGIVEHTGILDESESSALKRFITDRIIGTDLVSKDQKCFYIYVEGLGLGWQPNVDLNNIFAGEPFYFYDGSDEFSYLLLDAVVNNTPLGNEEDVVPAELFQDINNNGVFDAVFGEEYTGGNSQLKTHSGMYFKNYKTTVNYIVDTVLSSLDEDDMEVYPTIPATYYKDYTFDDVRVPFNLDSETSFSLGSQSYRNIVFAPKDLGAGVNNMGFSEMIFQSVGRVEMDVYVKYHRQGVGYATWKNSSGQSTGEFYCVTSDEPLVIDGQYKFGVSGDKISEGASINIDFKTILENAYFGNTKNNTYFIEPFPVSSFNTSDSIKEIVLYDSQPSARVYSAVRAPNGEIAYEYVNENASYLQILFTPKSTNSFQIGFLNYIPYSEWEFTI